MTRSSLARRASALVPSLLAEPDLPERVRELPPRALARIVERVGLEDAAELVALATPEQLLTVLDDDLWTRVAPGEDDELDAARFVTWLEVLLEAGERVCAEKLAAMPEDLLVVALHELVLAIPLDRLAEEIEAAEDSEIADKALSDHLHEELDDMVLVARTPDGWDAVLAAVLALDRDHHDVVARVLGRCAALADGELEEEGGLYEVLTKDASLRDDVAGDREERRAAEGFVSGASAKSFLALARRPLADGPYVRDVVTRGWFRDLRAAIAVASSIPTTSTSTSRAAALLAELARDEEKPAGQKRRALPAARARVIEPPLVRAMRGLTADRVATRSEELAYLANVLAAGAGHEGTRLRPADAALAALATTSLGLDLVAGDGDDGVLVEALAQHPADALFRRGFHALFTRLTLPAATRIAALLAEEPEKRTFDADRAALESWTSRGEPWRAATALELFAIRSRCAERSSETAAALVALVAELPRRAGALEDDAAGPFFATVSALAEAEALVEGHCVPRAHRHRVA